MAHFGVHIAFLFEMACGRRWIASSAEQNTHTHKVVRFFFFCFLLLFSGFDERPGKSHVDRGSNRAASSIQQSPREGTNEPTTYYGKCTQQTKRKEGRRRRRRKTMKKRRRKSQRGQMSAHRRVPFPYIIFVLSLPKFLRYPTELSA
jgi:hypothetical protein